MTHTLKTLTIYRPHLDRHYPLPAHVISDVYRYDIVDGALILDQIHDGQRNLGAVIYAPGQWSHVEAHIDGSVEVQE